LRGQKNLLVPGERLFERADAGFAADDERRHLLGKNNHIAHRHHGYALHFLFFSIEHGAPEIYLKRPKANGRFSEREAAGSTGLFEQTPVDFASADHIFSDDKVAHFALHRQVIHDFEHEVFQDHAQASRADFALKRQLGNGGDGIIREAKADVFEFEEALVLLEQGILGFSENANQCWVVEIVHDARDRKAADKFGNEAVADEIAGLNLLEEFGVALLCSRRRRIGVEAECTAAGSLFDNF